MKNGKNRQEIAQTLTEMVESFERLDCEVTAEQIRKILRSPRLLHLVAHTIKNPEGAFAEHLKTMALCMKAFADDGITLVDLKVCLLEGDKRLRSELVTKVRQLNDWRDLS